MAMANLGQLLGAEMLGQVFSQIHPSGEEMIKRMLHNTLVQILDQHRQNELELEEIVYQGVAHEQHGSW